MQTSRAHRREDPPSPRATRYTVPHARTQRVWRISHLVCLAQNDTIVMFNTILGLQPRAAYAGGKSRDEMLAETARDIADKVRDHARLHGTARSPYSATPVFGTGAECLLARDGR